MRPILWAKLQWKQHRPSINCECWTNTSAITMKLVLYIYTHLLSFIRTYIYKPTAKFNLYLFDKDTAHRFTSNTRWGFNKFLELGELHKASNGFLVNDAIYIGVEFLSMATREYLWNALMDSTRPQEWIPHQELVYLLFYSLRILMCVYISCKFT